MLTECMQWAAAGLQSCMRERRRYVQGSQPALADHQHARLVKYYSYFGFQTVKVVGENGLRDVPDQVVWGGVGTRMDADLPQMLRKWSPALRKRWECLRAGPPHD